MARSVIIVTLRVVRRPGGQWRRLVVDELVKNRPKRPTCPLTPANCCSTSTGSPTRRRGALCGVTQPPQGEGKSDKASPDSSTRRHPLRLRPSRPRVATEAESAGAHIHRVRGQTSAGCPQCQRVSFGHPGLTRSRPREWPYARIPARESGLSSARRRPAKEEARDCPLYQSRGQKALSLRAMPHQTVDVVTTHLVLAWGSEVKGLGFGDPRWKAGN